MSQVPAATRALGVLRFLASQTEPVSLDRIIRAVEMPRSTAYHLLNTMIDEGFVSHLADEHRYGLGVAAFEVGSGYHVRSRSSGSRGDHSRRSSTRPVRVHTSRSATVAMCCTSSRSGLRDDRL